MSIGNGKQPCIRNTDSFFIVGLDSSLFRIDGLNGEIRTAIDITAPLGHTYSFTVVASNGGISKDQLVSIVVSAYNRYPPVYLQPSASVYVYRQSIVGTHITTIHISDDDQESYNQKSTFRMTAVAITPFGIEVNSGELTVVSVISDAWATVFNVTIIAENYESSPKRETTTSVSIHIVNISAPQNLTLRRVSFTFVDGCWDRPQFGYPIPIYEVSCLNIDNSSSSQPPPLIFDSANDTVCIRISPLVPFENYILKVYVLDVSTRNRGPESDEIQFSAKSLVCEAEPCFGGGSCVISDDDPVGFRCQCPVGRFGLLCESINICLSASQPCKNDGRCESVTDAMHRCTCVGSFWGATCELINPCFSAPCQNGGICMNNSDSSYICNCTYGYYGDLCQNRNLCELDPCHGSSCTNTSSSSYLCQCIGGYFGRNCDQYNACLSAPCLNGATCTSTGDIYLCQCLLGYQRKNCDYYNPCLLTPCSNGGTCINIVSGQFTCSCSGGFYGSQCKQIDSCASRHPCVNGECQSIGDGKYSCKCRLGWYDDNCSKYNPCVTDPCINGATCLNLASLQYACQCHAGFYGLRCEFFNPCSLIPCQNGGSCQNVTKGSENFTCTCRNGYYGNVCQYYNICSQFPCLNEATCVLVDANKYRCDCPLGYYGRNCEFLNGCFSTPCANSGTCSNTTVAGGYICYCSVGYYGAQCQSFDPCELGPCLNGGFCNKLDSNIESYSCQCLGGFYGRNCEGFNACYSSPCLNNATCLNNSVASYSCACLLENYGSKCERRDLCRKSPCLNQGVCVNISDTDFICSCQYGYYGSYCQLFNPCVVTICGNAGVCVNTSDRAYQCTCSFGYYGVQCEKYNPCLKDNPCQHAGTCQNTSGNSFTCDCTNGYYGDRCQSYNPCATSPCLNNGMCSNLTNSSYNCSCLQGTFGSNCQNFEFCSQEVCFNGATCTLTNVQSNLDPASLRDVSVQYNRHGVTDMRIVNYFNCACAPGFKDISCDVDVNECASKPCLNGAICIDRVNMYMCICADGFTGITCNNSVNLCSSIPCTHGSICTNLVNKYICTCTPGYTGDRCEFEINECISYPCRNGAKCLDVINGFSCNCSSGYSGNQCELNINECASSPCQNFGFCQDAINGYTCTCLVGYTGLNCQMELNECQSSPCVQGTCDDLINAYACRCPHGYLGVNCDINAIGCSSTPCLNDAKCLNLINSFYCNCPPGFTGLVCETNVNECHSLPCHNAATCLDQVNAFMCQCTPGFVGTLCEVNFNECASVPCQHLSTCHDLISAFDCVCSTGYTGRLCEVKVDECQSTPCVNGATCLDQVASYSCVCATGYSGVNCEDDTNECLSNPCLNGARCHNEIGFYWCPCIAGITGKSCETNIDECASRPCQFSGLCIDRVNYFECLCKNGYFGKDCSIIGMCESDITTSDYGTFDWPVTSHSTVASVSCPYGQAKGASTSFAFRWCNATDTGAVLWTEPDYSKCHRSLVLVAREVLTYYAELTRNQANVTSGLISEIADGLLSYSMLATQDFQTAELCTVVVSNVFEVNATAMLASNDANHTADKFLMNIDVLLTNVANSDKNMSEIFSDNLYILQMDFVTQSISQANVTDVHNYTFAMINKSTTSGVGDVRVTIPSSLITILPLTRVILKVFRRDLIFIENKTTADFKLRLNPIVIVSTVVVNRSESKLFQPITISFLKDSTLVNLPSTCGFWSKQDHVWSTREVTVLKNNDTHIVCESITLGHFAHLAELNLQKQERIPEMVGYISFIGCAVFLFFMTMTTVTFVAFQCLRSEKFGKMWINTFVAMVLLNVFFILASLWHFYNMAGCATLMFLFHYFLLTSFLWLTIKMYSLYETQATVFISYENYFVLKRMLLAWTLPLLLAAISLIIDATAFEQVSSYCKIAIQKSALFYVMFIGYVCIAMIVCSIICSIVLIQVSRSDTSDPRIVRCQVIGAPVIVSLFGCTWLVGLCAARFGGLALEAVFCVLNSVSGITIFVVFCLLSDETRAALITCLVGWKVDKSKAKQHRVMAQEVFAVSPVIKTNNTWISMKNDFLHGSRSNKCDSIKCGPSEKLNDVLNARHNEMDDERRNDENAQTHLDSLKANMPPRDKVTYI